MADRIKGITIEIDGDTSKLSKALKNVNNDIRTNQNTLKDVDKLLKLDPGNTTLLQQKYKALGQSIEQTKQKLQTLKTAESQMMQNGQVGTAEWDALQREIVETEQKLKGLNQEMKNFGSVSAQSIAAAGEKVKSVGQGIEGAGRAIMPASAAMIGFGTVAAAKYADVDKTMTLTNQTMGNTAEQAALLDKAMSEAAANSTFGMSDAATASLNFARAGLTAEQAASALAPAMNLAAGEGGDLDTVSSGLVATINGFHGSFGDAGKYADVFAAACNKSALDVNSLSGAMSVAAPVFAAAGYKVNDAALYMGVMANNGIDADKAANSLKTGLARLVSPAKEGAEMMDQLGISVTKSDGTMKSSVQIQKELHDAFGKLSESEQIAAASAIFGKNQMAPWLALINTAPEDVGELDESLKHCTGTTDEMSKAMMGGFGGSIEKLKSSLDVLMTSLGKVVAEFLIPIINGIQKFVDWLNKLDPVTRKIVVGLGLLVAAAGPVLIFVGKIVTAVGSIMTLAPKFVSMFSAIKTAAGVLGGGLKALWAVMMANPITLVIAAIAAIVAAFIYFWNTSESFRQFWINLWEGIKTAVANFVDAIKVLWGNIATACSQAWETIKNVVSVAIQFLAELFTTALEILMIPWRFIWENFGTYLVQAWENIKTLLGKALEAIKTLLTTAWNAIKTALEPIIEAIKTVITTAWNAIKTAISTVLGAIKSVVTSVWNAIKSVVTSILNAIKTTATNVWNAIKTTVSNVIGNIKSTVSSGLNAVKSTFTSILNGIKSTVSNVWNGIVGLVSGAVQKLKNLVNFHWELPHIKLPHFSISGSFSLNPPSIPHISVSWYKKAMENGMILNDPTIFGAAGGKLLGGGEAGPEAVVGVDSLRSMIGEAVAAAAGAGGDIIIPVSIGQRRIDTIVVDALQRNNYRSGGR